METLQNTLQSSLVTVRGDFFDTLSSILPVALAIVGAGMVIMLGIKYFKRISNK